MGRIQVLDCTLRDGGYCNQWKFGYENAKKIISSLVNAGVEIIECGFITKRVEYDNNITKFTDIAQIRGILPQSNDDKMFVAMMNYGECDLKALPKYDGSSINGIRVAFHKKDAKEALKLCEAIKEKGYLVFIQAMVSLSYSDEEFLSMIKQVNDLEPYAFYIVDSFGEMKKSDLTRLYYLVEHNLKESIKIGFHSHNNIQLAYSNAQTLVDMHTNRELIIDSSVYGMGRGAGNLNTELFVEYLNENNGANYDLKPLLTIIDEILNDFYQRNYWGYSLPNYISATHHAHPNYASYLDDKKTLTVENMNEIFDLIEDDKRVSFDKDYIEDLYIRFMTTGKVHEEHKLELEKMLRGKSILLIAAGKSSVNEKDKIINFSMKENVVTISVNYDYSHVKTNFIFVSNLRRYRDIDPSARGKCIVTSNVTSDGVYLQTKYWDLLAEDETVKDNAGMMAVKFLLTMGIKDIYLAGFDGYTHDSGENFGDNKMNVIMKNAVLDATNESMIRSLTRYSKVIDIHFLTTPKYVRID